MIKFWVNFGFIGSPVITMFHQVIYSEIVTLMLKPVGEVLVYLKTVGFSLRVSFQCAKSQTETFARRFFFLCFVCTVQKKPSVQ